MIDGYFNKKKNPVIRKSICVYMDVLGFSEETMDSFRSGTASKYFDTFYKVHTEQIMEMMASYSPRWWGVKVFTDNIVLGFPIRSGDGESEFGSTVFTASQYQWQMAKAGFFVRGAMTIGDLFMDDNIAFGPALIEANNLEKTQARDPRIVLSHDVHKMINIHLTYYGDPFDSPHNRDVLKDADGILFLNYLDEANIEFSNGVLLDWDGLAAHKDHIERNLSKYRKNPRVWAKYFWLASYHDWFVSMYTDVDGYSNKIHIAKRLARTHPEMLIKKRTKRPNKGA